MQSLPSKYLPVLSILQIHPNNRISRRTEGAIQHAWRRIPLPPLKSKYRGKFVTMHSTSHFQKKPDRQFLHAELHEDCEVPPILESSMSVT